jgi:hypothetical protein
MRTCLIAMKNEEKLIFRKEKKGKKTFEKLFTIFSIIFDSTYDSLF